MPRIFGFYQLLVAAEDLLEPLRVEHGLGRHVILTIGEIPVMMSTDYCNLQ